MLMMIPLQMIQTPQSTRERPDRRRTMITSILTATSRRWLHLVDESASLPSLRPQLGWCSSWTWWTRGEHVIVDGRETVIEVRCRRPTRLDIMRPSQCRHLLHRCTFCWLSISRRPQKTHSLWFSSLLYTVVDRAAYTETRLYIYIYIYIYIRNFILWRRVGSWNRTWSPCTKILIKK